MADRSCSVEGCKRELNARGFCSGHYRRWQLSGDPGPARMTTDPNEIRIEGDVAEMDLYRKNEVKYTTVFDAEDIPKVRGTKWITLTSQARRLWGPYVFQQTGPRNSRVTRYLHRLLVDCPDDMWVDHIDGDTLNNRKANLRICTPQQNVWANRTRKGRKRKGVTQDKRTGRWVAQITRQFDNFDDAEKQRQEWEEATHGDYATRE